MLPKLYEVTNTQTQTIYHNQYTYETLGAYGDVNMSYKDFLYLEASLRNDWSSSLPRSNNSFAYPSVSAGFIFSDLMKDQTWLSYGKLRASIAGTANDAAPNQIYTTYSNVTPTVFANVRYSYPQNVGNLALKPEHTNQQEVGLDLGFLKRKINLEATYYYKKIL